MILLSKVLNVEILFVKKPPLDFLGSLVVESSPANAEFNPWSGKIPHARGKLRLWATTTEARAPKQEKPFNVH